MAGAGVLVMALIVTMDVILRYGFNAPTKWAGELSALLLVVAVFLGLAHTLRENAHIRVDFILQRLPGRVQDWMKVIASALFLVFTIILCHLTWKGFALSFTLKSTSRSLWDVPVWPARVFIPLGFALISLLLICNIYTETKLVLRKPKEGK